MSASSGAFCEHVGEKSPVLWRDCNVPIFTLVIWTQLCTMPRHIVLPAPVFDLSYITSDTDLGLINDFLVSCPFCRWHYYVGPGTILKSGNGFCFSFLMYPFPFYCYYVLLWTLYGWVIPCIIWQINIWTKTMIYIMWWWWWLWWWWWWRRRLGRWWPRSPRVWRRW